MNLASPWINYHHLLYFKTIAEEGSVSKAAEKLRLGQPTLSAQLKQFEETIGVQLFERRHKKLILTEQGQVALNYARGIFKMGNEMLEVLHDRISPSRVSVQIGALDIIPKQILYKLTAFALNSKDCLVSIQEGKADEMVRELTAHRLDLFVSNHLPSLQDTKGLFHRSLGKRPVGIFGAPSFKQLRKNFPASLSGQKFILPSYDGKLRYDLDHWFHSRGVIVDAIAETQDISLKKILATEGVGLIPAALHAVEMQVDSGSLIQIGSLEGVSEELFLIAAQRKITNPVAANLMKSFQL